MMSVCPRRRSSVALLAGSMVAVSRWLLAAVTTIPWAPIGVGRVRVTRPGDGGLDSSLALSMCQRKMGVPREGCPDGPCPRRLGMDMMKVEQKWGAVETAPWKKCGTGRLEAWGTAGHAGIGGLGTGGTGEAATVDRNSSPSHARGGGSRGNATLLYKWLECLKRLLEKRPEGDRRGRPGARSPARRPV